MVPSDYCLFSPFFLQGIIKQEIDGIVAPNEDRPRKSKIVQLMKIILITMF